MNQIITPVNAAAAIMANMQTPYETSIDKKIFNFEKTDYSEASLFFGQASGLFDTINQHYPQLKRLYSRLKALDWGETEFPFSQCNLEFKRMKPELARPMIVQLGWQWETDSIAARTIAPVMSNFLTNDTAFRLYQRIGDNESTHAATYAEIVRFSFDNPTTVMDSVLGISESAQRLEVVSKVFAEAYKAGLELSMGIRKRDQETFNIFFMFIVALFMMERLQFMISFGITFTYSHHSHFLPIGKAVQKICQDEYEIHALAGAHMYNILMDTGEGITANWACRDTIVKMFNEIMSVEQKWLPFLLAGNEDLFGVTLRDYQQWGYFCAGDVASVLGIKTDFTVPKTVPIDFLKNWINISSIQASLQEEKNGSYMIGAVIRDDMGQVFDTAGL